MGCERRSLPKQSQVNGGSVGWSVSSVAFGPEWRKEGEKNSVGGISERKDSLEEKGNSKVILLRIMDSQPQSRFSREGEGNK